MTVPVKKADTFRVRLFSCRAADLPWLLRFWIEHSAVRYAFLHAEIDAGCLSLCAALLTAVGLARAGKILCEHRNGAEQTERNASNCNRFQHSPSPASKTCSKARQS